MSAPVAWYPPGWIARTSVDVKALTKKLKSGEELAVLRDVAHPYEPENRKIDDVTMRGVIKLEKHFDECGYYTRGKGGLADEFDTDPLAPVAVEVLHNAGLLRDAWNTAPAVWRAIRRWLGSYKLTVDPFSNPGTQELPDLLRRLDGSSPEVDGFANDRGWPTNWRGALPYSQAGAAVNGPHSATERWLRLTAAYGVDEIAAAFVPDAADVWWHDACREHDEPDRVRRAAASLVFRFGRVHCVPPPGVKASSPRGTSAVLLWLPEWIDRSRLPDFTQRALAGEPIEFAYDYRKSKSRGARDLICTVSLARNASIDLGFGAPKTAPTTDTTSTP